jgi:UDP:flavonoid glycosyltransferase YjiC (YdhE family)
VTTGPAIDPSALRGGSHVEVIPYVPHEQLMPRASLLIGHGGHSTTLRALAHDLPVLVLPLHPQLDQPMIGAAVAAAGAGQVLPPTASPESIRQAAQQLLAEGPHRAAAATIGARLRAHQGLAAAADELDAVLTESRLPPSSPPVGNRPQ